MALVLADRVKETTTTTGTGTVTLLGASTGFQSFAAVGNANTTYYTIAAQTGTEWEVGIGTYTSSGTTLTRTTVLSSSNSGSLVNFSAGTKDVFVTYPSSRSIYADGTVLTATNSSVLPVANGGTGLASGTSGGVLAYTATGTLASSAALAANALVIGGGAGAAPSTTTTGTGVVTALGVNVGTAGAFVVNGGALGSPSSVGTMPAFTLGGTVSGGGNQINNVVIGTSTPLAGAFTSLTTSSTVTINGGTANGMAYLDASKVLTTGTALVFDTSGGNNTIRVTASGYAQLSFVGGSTANYIDSDDPLSFFVTGGERGRFTSTGLAVTGTLSATGTLSGGTSGTAYSFSGSAPATSLTLDSSGNLGIGTTSPNLGGASKGVSINGSASSILETNLAGSRAGYVYSFSSSTILGEFRNLPLVFNTNDTERMRLDSSGNLGLGVTPSAWGTANSVKALQIPSGSLWNFLTGYLHLGQNYYFNGTNRIYSNTAAATEYQQSLGIHSWFNAPSGTAGNAITFTQAMTLDASGNLGIGTSSPSSFDSFANNLVVGTGSGTEGITIYAGSAGSSNLSFADGTGPASYQGFITYSHVTDALGFYVNYSGSSSARMSIDSSGNLLVGVSTANANGGVLQLKSGITFPATAVAATDANTLDDYEEGTWTPTQGAGLTVVGAFSSSGRYTKIGRSVSISGRIAGATSIATTAGTAMMGAIPFSIGEQTAVGTMTNGSIDVIGGIGGFTTTVYSATTIGATVSFDFSLTYSV